MTNKLIGSVFSVTVSVMYALVSNLTRSMQATHYSIVLFYYAIFSVVVLGVGLIAEAWVKQEPMRVLQISFMQFLWMCVPSFFNTLGISFNTIALQNEKSGFITMIGYINIVYSFCGDVFIFDTAFSRGELVGVGIVVCVLLFLMSQSVPALKVGEKNATK
jgi:drug/metabolite transporter (DMT)-like permease